MMRSSRTNQKRKAPAYANIISPNTHPPTGVTFYEENVDEDTFDSILDNFEPIGNPSFYSTNPNSVQNPQINPNLQEAPLLSDWSMRWDQQYMNQNAISASGYSTFGGESSFGSFNRSLVNRDVTGSSFLFCPTDTEPFHTRKNVNFNTDQSGVQGKYEGGFLSLGLGGTSETVSSSQPDSRGISGKLKEADSNELKIARAQKATGQTFDDGFMGSSHHHILQMQQNDRRLGRANKLTEVASTELKMVHAQKAKGQILDADFMGFQRNNSGFSNQFSNVDRVTSTYYEVGVHSKLSSEQGSSRNHVSQMQQNDGRNIRSGDLDHYKGNHQSVHSGTLGGDSALFFKSQQHKLKPPKFVKHSRMTSNYTPPEQLQHLCSTTANSPNYADKQGQVTSQNDTRSQVHRGNLSSQRTATPQVSWVGRGLEGTDAPFPKRLGVELSVRNSPQSSQGHLSPMGTSLQTTNTGQICQFSDKRSTRMPHNVRRPIGQSDVAPVSYRVNHQEPSFTYGQSQKALIQLPKGPQGAPFTNASTVHSQSQKLDFHVRPHHKRTALAPQSASRWVQRQKIIHPTFHHSMPKPPVPATTALVHPSIPVGSRAQPTGPVAGHVRSVRPRVSNVKPRAPVASVPAVSHIKWKDPDATSKLSGYKCFLCKRDLALTSEGVVFQPAVAPPVAVLPCGHTFHDQCLQNITLDDQAKDPPCIPCAIGEN